MGENRVPSKKVWSKLVWEPGGGGWGGGGVTWIFRGAHTLVIKIEKYP